MRPISRSEVMAELADVWEGNPRLTLYELFDVLRRAGLAPDSTNYEALSLCSYLTSLRPARVPLTPQGHAAAAAVVIMRNGHMRCALYPDFFILRRWPAALRPPLPPHSFGPAAPAPSPGR